MLEFLSLLGGAGMPISWAIVAWFVYRGDKREEKLTTRISALEDRYATTIEGTVKDCRNELVRAGEIFKRVEPQLTRLEHAPH